MTENQDAMNILLVGARSYFRSAARALIRRGHNVIQEEDSSEALRVARKWQPSLIATTIELCQMDGFELCRLLKLDKRLCDVPCALVTDSSLTRQQENLTVSLGVLPLTVDNTQELVEKILQITEQTQTAGSSIHRELMQVLEGIELSAATQIISKLDKKISILEKQRKDIEQRGRQLHRILEHTSAIPWEMEIENQRFTYVGPQVVELFGYPYIDWFEDGFWASRLFDEDREWVLRSIQVARSEDLEIQYRFYAADGRVIWIHDNIIIDSGPATLQGFMCDITDKRQREKKLRRTERALTTLIQIIETVIGGDDEKRVLDEVCRILVEFGGYRFAWISVSRNDESSCVQTLAQYGYAQDYFKITKTGWEYYGRCSGTTGAAVCSQQTQITDDVLHNPNYDIRQAEAREHGDQSSIAFPFYYDSSIAVLNLYAPVENAFHPDEVKLLEQFVRVLAHGLSALRALREKRLAKDVIKDRETNLICILNTVLDAIVTMDENGIIQSLNAAAEQMFRYQALEVVGKSVNHLIPDSYGTGHHGFISDYIRHNISGDSVKRCEEQARRKTGEIFPVEISLTAYEISRKRIITAVMRDLTESKRKEREQAFLREQLHVAQKMQTIGHLTGGIAHDFNNILASIMGYTGLAQSRQTSNQDPKLAGYLKEVNAAAERARDLIAQLLVFSRGASETPKALNLSSEIKEIEKMIQVTVPATIGCKLQIEKNLPLVDINSVHFHQLVMNLCLNARDALQGRGYIGIQLRQTAINNVECASCRQQSSGKFVELSVKDSGSGIEPEVLVQMFDPFFTTKEAGKGTGIGLSMIHGIVHDYGGHIVVETASGIGTTFKILLPPSDQNLEEPEQLASERIEDTQLHQQRRIMVVDDETALTGFLSELLESRGYSVIVVNDAYDALTLFNQDPSAIDLILTDQTMPGITGAEMATEMLALRPELPVILTTGYSELIDEAGAKALGIRAYLSKPMETQQLLQTIKELLNT